MSEPEKPDPRFLRLQKAAEELGEHFDSVQIFASIHEPTIEGGTVNMNFGKGNWFARYGQVSTWLLKQNAISGHDAIEGITSED